MFKGKTRMGGTVLEMASHPQASWVRSALAVALLIVLGIGTALLLHSAKLGVIVTALGLLILGIATRRRKITPQHLADELERHLLGTEGPWDWDDTTSI